MQAIILNLNENTHLFLWGALSIPLSSYHIVVIVWPQFLPVLKKDIRSLIKKKILIRNSSIIFIVFSMPNRENMWLSAKELGANSYR